MLFVKVYCFINFFLFAVTSKLFKTGNQSNRCMKKVVENIVQQSYTLYVGKQNGSFNSLLRAASKMNINLKQLKLIQSPFVNNILHFDDVKHFNETMAHLRNLQLFGTRSRCICITENERHVKTLVEMLWQHRFYKSLVILEKENQITLYEIDYKNSNCGEKVGITEKHCNVKDIEQIFNPNMKRYFKNCQLDASFALISPWVYFENGELKGIFVDFLKLVSEIEGLKLTFLPHNPIYDEDISENYNFDSLYEDFENGIGDVFVGLVNNFPATYYFESSSPLTPEVISLVIPKGKRMPYWKAMLHLYSVKGWTLTIALFLMFYIILCILGYVTGNKNLQFPIENFFFTYALFFAMSIPKTLKTTKMKLLFLTMCWIFTINSIIIQGKLYSILSVPVFERDIKDLKSLFEYELPIVFKEGMAKAFLFLDPEYQHVLDIYTITNATIEETAVKISKTKDFVTVFHEGMFIVEPHLKDMVTTIDVARFHAVYLFKKQHELFERINFSIKRLIESGFMDRLLSAYKWNNMLTKKYVQDAGVFKLSLLHFQGSFCLLLVGYILSTFSFLLELSKLYFKKTNGNSLV